MPVSRTQARQAADSQLDHTEQGANQLIVSEVAARQALYQAVRVNAWNAAGNFFSMAIWPIAYFDRKNARRHYALQCILEGFLANAVSFPFAVAARMASDRQFKAAIKQTLWYLPPCLLLDCAYQAIYDGIVAADQESSFEEYAVPTFSPREIAIAVSTFLGGSSLIYYLLGKMLRLGVRLPEALGVGFLYTVNYLEDSLFNINLDPLQEGLLNLFYACLTGAACGFMSDTVQDISRYIQARTQANQASTELPVLNIADEEKHHTLPSTLQQRLLPSAENEQEDDDQEDIQPQRQTCGAILKSYFSFWCCRKAKPPQMATASQNIAGSPSCYQNKG